MGGRLLDWLGAGVASSLPDPVADMPSRIVTGSTAFYWATDTKHLFVYDPAGGPSWFDIDMAAITAVSTESIQDMIATFLAAGTGITLTYNDAGNLLTIAGTVTQYTDEMAQDAVAAMIAAGTDTGLTIVYNDAGNAIAFTITVATASDIWGGTLDTAFITPKRLKDWRTPVSVTDAATITLDGSLGANFYVTLGGNRILANPTNFNPGQFGVIHVTQDGTGTRTLTFGANWKFGSVSLNSNVLTTTAGAVDAIHYYVRTDGTITCFIVANLTGSPAKIQLNDLSNVAISSPANADVLTYDSGTGKWKNAAAVSGSSSGFTTVNDTTFATSTASLVVNVSAYDELLLMCLGVTTDNAGSIRNINVSTDGGSTYNAANYNIITAAGAILASVGNISFHASGSSAARYGSIRMFGIRLSGVPKMMQVPNDTTNPQLLIIFTNSSLPITHIKYLPASGNFTGGRFVTLGK